MSTRIVAAFAVLLVTLAACGDSARPGFLDRMGPGQAETPDPGETADPGDEAEATTTLESAVPTAGARTAEQFDTTTAEQRAEAEVTVKPAGEQQLGTTIASIGDPTDPGFWAETPLVTEVIQGRLEYTATGKSVQVELRPSGGEPGSGSRVSLPALRVLEAPLAALPELVVFAL